MIVQIEHVVKWRLIYQRKQTFIDKNNDKENGTRTNHFFQVDDQILIRNNQANKYGTLFKGPYTIIQTWISGMLILSMVEITDMINIRLPKTILYILGLVRKKTPGFFLNFAGKPHERKPNKAHTNRANIMCVHYYHRLWSCLCAHQHK